jgi:hypothetical protein
MCSSHIRRPGSPGAAACWLRIIEDWALVSRDPAHTDGTYKTATPIAIGKVILFIRPPGWSSSRRDSRRVKTSNAICHVIGSKH